MRDNPEDHTLYGKRATCFLNMGALHTAFAIEDAQRSCMMEPLYIDGYVLYSKANVAHCHLWQAEIGVRKGLLIEPENASLLEQLELVEQRRNDPSTFNPRFLLCPLYDPPDKYGLIYSHGLHWEGLPELLMVDIPSNRLLSAMELVGTVAGNLVEGSLNLAHGDTINIDGDRVQALMVSEESNRSSLIRAIGQWNEEAEVTILKYLDVDNPPESKDRETSVPHAPNGNENRLESILNKWRDADSFTFLIDGGEENESPFNRMQVPLSIAMKHHSCQAKWDADLTREEGQYVWNNWDDCKLHARATVSGIGYKQDCHYIQNIARHAVSPAMVQSRYHQGVKLAAED